MMDKPRTRLSFRSRVILAIFIALGVIYFVWRDRKENPTPAAPPNRSAQTIDKRPEAAANDAAESTTLIENATLRDQDGKVIYRGEVDLAETIARINDGHRLREFQNDGITFENRERRLPRKSAGYYREWVHPTPGRSGPGPQRIVAGEEGELYYTPDHYETFQRLDVGKGETR